MLLMGAQTAVDAQGLAVSDVQNSGCLRGTRARANENEQRRTIILTKEGDILSVQLLGFKANCCISGFDVKSNMKDGSETMPCLLSVSVGSNNDEEECDCICPYNISFTINGVEVNSFRFSCWWYDGLVSLTEGEPLALEDIKEDVSIDGTIYTLDKVAHTAKLIRKNAGESEVNIPSELSYEGQEYTVNSIGSYVFHSNAALTSVTIPGSITYIGEAAFYGCSNLKDICCQADNVPVTGSWVFDNTPIASTTLHVPAGSIEEYKATSPWSGFGNIVALAEQYFPEGTKWTEIRLDTLKYDSWYSKVGDSWVPNFETIEYHVEGDYTEKWGDTYKCVFSNDPEWMGTPLLIKETSSDVSVSLIYDEESKGVMSPATVYQFNWSVGKGLYYEDLLEASSTGIVPYYFFYGVIDEIKEGDFGGVRPLKYVDLDGKAPALEFGYCIDTNGGRIIQGIGITEWNDGECIFGPPNPNLAKTLAYGERHYRSMLVHFERDGEVLYNVWPEKEAIEVESVTFTRDQMATIILPTAPDASMGKYYRLDRVENGQIIFEQELQPQTHIPYIIVPSEDFSIDPGALDLEGLQADTVSIGGISFIGSYVRKALPQRGSGEGADSFYIDIIDTTPDCSLSPSGETGQKAVIGALRAYLSVRWDDPIDYGGTRGPQEKKLIVLKDNPDGIEDNEESRLKNKGFNAAVFDLSGRSLPGRPRSGLYIEGNRKTVR